MIFYATDQTQRFLQKRMMDQNQQILPQKMTRIIQEILKDKSWIENNNQIQIAYHLSGMTKVTWSTLIAQNMWRAVRKEICKIGIDIRQQTDAWIAYLDECGRP